MILSLALLESAGLFIGIACLVETRPYVLGFFFVVFILMQSNFPTAGRVRAWLEQQMARLAELRQQLDRGPA